MSSRPGWPTSRRQGSALQWRHANQFEERGHGQVIIHSTKAMQVAWALYEALGFRPSHDLDFMQGQLQVYGFRLEL